MVKKLKTKHGTISFPTFMPVTTFGDKYPLDKMVQPYLKRTSQCLMVSHYYAQEMKKRPNMPIFIDSGGFAGLFEGSEIVEYDDYACIKTKDGKELNPLDVLRFQIENADIGSTLDFIIPPGLDEKECIRRQKLTIKNALYSQKYNTDSNLVLFASLQCWDEKSARLAARVYADAGFTGIAIGGMVPHAKDKDYIKNIVRVVRAEVPNIVIHVFGIGNVDIIPELLEVGADSFDSSSYVRNVIGNHNSKKKGAYIEIFDALNYLLQLSKVINNGNEKKIEMCNSFVLD